ncbi:MAG: hypothetical protein WCO02_04575 [Bacteroidota bacterium]
MKKILYFLLIASIAVTISCTRKSDPPPVPYVSFKVNGVQKTYYNYARFAKDFCSSSTYCGNFNLNDIILPAEMIKIGLPGNPYSGQVLKTGDYRFVFTYVDPNQVWYTVTNGGSFKLTLTSWEGQGGWASGQFSGTLKVSANDSVVITDGSFLNGIWTYASK